MEKRIYPGIAMSPRMTNFGPVLFMGRLYEGLKAAGQAGFKFVELSLRSVSDVNPDELAQKLDEYGMSISAVATGQACLFDDLCLGAFDDARRRKAIAHFKEIAKFAKQIHSGAVIIGGIRGRLDGSKDLFEENTRKGIDAIRECAEWTDSIGIPLLIEPINRYETNWIFTASDGCKLLEEIGIDSVKLLLDTFHMNIEEASIKEAIIETGNHVGYVHFADNTRHAPGQGNTDFKTILSALEHINYSGPIVAEVLPLPDDQTALLKTKEFWQKLGLMS